MNNREKIKVEYYTVDGKTHNFETSGPLMVNLEASQTELLPDNEESKNIDANNK